jgi:hypothetical protein
MGRGLLAQPYTGGDTYVQRQEVCLGDFDPRICTNASRTMITTSTRTNMLLQLCIRVLAQVQQSVKSQHQPLSQRRAKNCFSVVNTPI